MEIQINNDTSINIIKHYIIIGKEGLLQQETVVLTHEEMDTIVEAYLKEKYPDYWKHIKHRIDTAKEYQRVVTAIYATENPKTSENV